MCEAVKIVFDEPAELSRDLTRRQGDYVVPETALIEYTVVTPVGELFSKSNMIGDQLSYQKRIYFNLH